MDSELIDQIVNDYADRLLRAAVLILGDYHLAEDLVQETLIDAATHLSSFRGEAALYTWLYRILISAAAGSRTVNFGACSSLFLKMTWTGARNKLRPATPNR